MKLKLVLAFIAISLVACSSDDSAPVSSVTEKSLKKVITTFDGQRYEHLSFENNMVTERHLLENGQSILEDYYSYDSEGKCIGRSINIYNGDAAETTITYDEIGRLDYINTQYVYDGAFSDFEERSFDYNTPNKVYETVTRGDNSSSTFIYELDGNGRVIKVIGPGNNPAISQATFEGNNISTVSSSQYYTPGGYSTIISTHTYDMVTEVKGEYLKIKNNKFGDNIANNALYNQSITVLTSNYILQTESNDVTYNNIYQFDEDGFPLNVKVYENGQLYYDVIISYE